MRSEITNTVELVSRLEETKTRLKDYIHTLNPDQLKLSYSTGKWTTKELLIHLIDAETVLFERLRRIISQDNVIVYGFEPDQWSNKLKYSSMSFELYLPVFEASRNAVIQLAKEHYQSSDSITFFHNETGLRTLKNEFDKVVIHCEHHLGQIEKAIKKDQT